MDGRKYLIAKIGRKRGFIMKRRWIVVVMLLFAIAMCMAGGGCNYSSQERMEAAEKALEHYEQVAVTIDNNITQIKAAMELMPDDAKLKTIMTEALVAKGKIDTVVGQTKELIADIDKGGGIGSEIQAGGAAVSSVGAVLPPPWNGIAAIAGTLLGGIGTYMAKAKSKEAALNAAKYTAHKQATTEVMLTQSPEVQQALYAKVGEKRASLGVTAA